MSKKLLLSIWRMIRQSRTRFLSIMMIVALGVAFFIGVSSSATVMSESVDVYDDETDLKDITIYSKYGFDQEDADNLNKLEYVKKAEGTWFTDVFGVCGTDIMITRVHGYTEDQAINRFVLKDGRMPANEHEALAESGTELQQGFPIGSTVRFVMPEGEDNEDLKVKEVTVTGTIDTPVYLNMTKENSTLSNQYIRTYLYVPSDAFDMDYFTEMNILLVDAASMNGFSGTYEEWCEACKEQLEEISKILKDGRYNRIKEDAEAEYSDGLKEYEDGKETYESEIADAEKEIADAEEELEDGKRELQEGIDKLEDSQTELDDMVRDTTEELDSAEEKIEESKKELEKNKKDVKEKKDELKDGIRQIEDGISQIDDAILQLQTGADGRDRIQEGLLQIETAEESLRTLKGSLDILSDKNRISSLSQFPELAEAAASFGLDGDNTVGELKQAVKKAAKEAQKNRKLLDEQKEELLEQLREAGFTEDDPSEEIQDRLDLIEDGLVQVQTGLEEVEDGLAQIETNEENLNTLKTAAEQLQTGIAALEQAVTGYTALQEVLPLFNEYMTVGMVKDYIPGIEEAALSLGLDSDTSLHDLSAALTEKLGEYSAQLLQLQAGMDQIAETLKASGYDSADDALAALALKKQEVLETKKTLQDTQKELGLQKESLQAALDGLTAIKDGEKQLDEAEAGLSKLSDALKVFGDGALLKDVAAFSPSVALVYDTFGINENNTVKDLKDKVDDQLDELGVQKGKLLTQLDKILKAVKESGYDTPEEGVEDLRKKGRELAGKLTEAEEGGKKLAEAEEKIAEGEEQIKDAEQQVIDGRRELREGAEDAQRQIDEGWDTVRENRQKIEDGEAELADGKKELEEARADGQKELDDARKELEDARKEIDELEPNEWTVIDRQSHYASATYHSTIDQMAAIGRLFPVFFILVAALVCLTTMTRMVSEQRGEIGVLRALGFSKMQCASKYLIYAGTATVAGTVIGCIAGMLSFPIVIYHTWRMMYILPAIRLAVPWKLIFLTAAMFLAAMLAVTWSACSSDLTEVPAQLLRPKAPKLGRNILIERIGFIWNRLTFTWKVTIRNIFRYRSRFIMTVAGVAGCTALLVTGFGIRDSINSMVDIQFYDIFRFDGTVILEKDTDSDSAQRIEEEIRAIPGVVSLNRSGSYTAKAYGSGSLSETVSALVYAEPQDIEGSFSLRTRKGHHAISLSDDGVIISEKLAENLGVGPGDTFRMEDGDGDLHDIKVTAVTEMYIHHYAFMTEAYYRSLCGSAPSVISLHVKLENADDRDVQEKIAAIEGVDGIDFFDVILTNFRTMVKSLDLIVWTLIIASMSLAVVVLTNLINVNISEREREIATLKVLGFRKKEVRSYIFKENNILTVIGVIAGLPVGTVLHHYIMKTVEMDYIMFGREVLPASYVISFVLTVCFGIAVNHLMAGRLDRIRMVESLKSVE